MNDDTEILKHNYKVRASNPAPAEIPAPAENIGELVRLYNEAEKQQEQRLAALWAAMAERTGGRFVRFSNNTHWTVNQFLVPDPTRPDLVMASAMAGLAAYITEFSE